MPKAYPRFSQVVTRPQITSVEGHHINEVHISIATVPPTSYVLQLGTLAVGTTDNYASHIQACFSVIVSSYAEYHKLDPIQTKSTIIHHLKSTLTDRVAVNHCVVQSLRSSLDIELLELKCNVHPQDGIAKRCTDLLKVYDKEYNITSVTFGYGCCAVNFMYAMTKMRLKQGKGDPGGFKQYLRQEKYQAWNHCALSRKPIPCSIPSGRCVILFKRKT